jgi:hypothetical protein
MEENEWEWERTRTRDREGECSTLHDALPSTPQFRAVRVHHRGCKAPQLRRGGRKRTSTVRTMISSMSLHSPRVERSGLSKVLAISPPVTAANRSMPSKSACSIETTPASVNIYTEEKRVKEEKVG